MRKFIPFFFLVLLVVLSTNLIEAQTNVGRISGNVFDDNNLSLPGANIMISNLSIGTSTDSHGKFILLNVPEGMHVLEISFLGFQKKTLDVTIKVNNTTSIKVKLVPGVVLGDEVVVIGESLKGQAKALSQQKDNFNITNVVSSDQIGRFPDQNIGDALKRIPAISVNYDQGEARFVNIRGTEPRLNSVTINGDRVPSAEGEVRNVQVDLIPSDMIQTIEVSKALTPDMDADAIGGSINLVTRQAPNAMRLSATLGSGYNFLSEKPIYNGSLILGQRFLDGKLGAIFSGSIYDHNLGSHNTEGEWNGELGNYSPGEWDVRDYRIRRLRRSVSLGLDYSLTSSSVLYFDAIYNHRNDWENRYRLRYKDLEPDENNISQETTIERQTKGGIADNDNRRLEDQRTWTFGLRGDHIISSAIKLDWRVSYAKASEERPNERYIAWRVKKVPVGMNYSDERNPYYSENTGYDEFSLKELTEEFQYTDEKDFNAKFNLGIPISAQSVIKFGVRYKTKSKDRNNSFFEMELTEKGEAMFDDFTSIPNKDYTNSDFLAGDYKAGRFTTEEYLGSLNFNDKSLFTKVDLPEEYAAGNYTAEEKVTAGYVQYDHNFNDKLSMIIGVRVENTKIDYTGSEYDENTGNVTPTVGDDNYTNFLPGLHFKYNLNQNTILRFAFTNTISRPNYYDLVPYRAISEDNEELAIGNPELNPTTSMNFDLMAEKYYDNIGLIQAGVFYKKLNDFIYIHSEKNYNEKTSGNLYEEFFQPRNGAEASLFGVELGYQKTLFRYIYLYTNYTYTWSKTDNPSFPTNDLELPGTAPHTLNASIQYETQKWTLGASFNYTAAYIDPDGLDLTLGLERYYDAATYLDLNGSFQVINRLRIFAEANNLLNQPLRYYAGDKERTYQQEFYSARVTFGVKYDL